MSLSKVGARIVLEGEKEYSSAVTAATRATTQYKNELKLVETQTAGSAKSLDSLTQRSQAMTRVLDAQVQKQDALAATLQHAQQDYARVGKELDTYKTRLSDAKQKLDEMKKSGDASDEEIRQQEKLVGELAERVQLGERAYEKAGSRVEKWQGQLEKASVETRTTAAQLQNLGTEIDRASEAAANARFEQLSGKLASAGKTLETIGRTLSVVSAATGAALAASVKWAAEYETAVAKVSTIMDTNTMSVGQMSDSIMQLSNDTGIAASDLANSVYDAISAGRETGEAVEFVAQATDLARAGFSDTGTSLNLLSTILNAYGLEASEVTNISDKLINTQNRGRTTVAELASSMGSVIPTAAAFGVNLDQLASAYVVMTKNGIDTAAATTYLSGMLNELGKSGTTAADIIVANTGKSFTQLMQEGWNLSDVLSLVSINAKNSGLSMADMFGNVRAGRAALTLTNDGGAEFAATLESMGQAAGMTDAALEKVTNTSAAKFQKAMNSIKNAGIEAGSAFLTEFEPAITKILNAVQNAAKWFGNLDDSEKKLAVRTAVVVTAIGPAVSALSKLSSGASKAVGYYEKMRPAIAAAKTALDAQRASLEGMTAAQKLSTIATTGFEGAMQGLNTVMMANPALFVVGALGALSIAMVKARSDALASNEAYQSVKSTAEGVTASLQSSTAALQGTMDTASQSISNVASQGEIAGRLIDELRGLESQSSLTSQEQARMSTIVAQLNNLYPELGLAIDDVTGKTVQGADAVEDYVDAQMKMMRAKAYISAAQQGMEALVSAESALYDAKQQQEEIDRKVQGLEQELADARKDAADAAGNAATSSSRETAETIELANALAEAKKEQAGVESAVEAASAAVEDAQGKVDMYTEAANNMSAATTNAAAASDSLSESNAALSEASAASIEIAGQELDAYNNLDAGMQAVAVNVANSVTELQTNVSAALESQISMFDEFNAGTAMSTEQMLANMQSQIDGVTQWEQNLAALADKGINQDLLQHLAAMGPDGAAYVTTFNNMTSEELAQAGDLWQQSLDIQSFGNEAGQQLTQAVGEMAAGGSEAFASLAQQMGASANQSGQYTVKGLVDGMVAAQETAKAQGQDLGVKTIDSINKGLGVASPSTKARNSGQFVAQGLTQGIQAGQGSATAAASALGNAATSALSSSLSPSTWAALGANASAGLANGIASGQSAVVNAAASVAAAAISAANSKLEVNSPSKVFMRLGQSVDEGFALGIEKDAKVPQAAVNRMLTFGNVRPAASSVTAGGSSAGDYSRLVSAFREALQDANFGIWLNDREVGRGLRDMGVAFG